MQFKFKNPKLSVLGSVLLMVHGMPALAATVALNGGTGNFCSYTTYSADSSGNMVVICENQSQTPTPTPAPTPTTTPTPTPTPTPIDDIPANCTVVDITWSNSFKYGVSTWQHLPNGKMLAMRMKVPENKLPASTGTAYSDVPKYMSISSKACDFSAALALKGCMGGARTNDPSIWTTGGNETGMCKLPPPGSYVYYNVKNTRTLSGEDVCPVGKDCKFGHFW